MKDGDPGSFSLLGKVHAGSRNKIKVYVETLYFYLSKTKIIVTWLQINQLILMISEKMSLLIPVLGAGVRTIMTHREKISVEMRSKSGSCHILLKSDSGVVEQKKFGKVGGHIHEYFLRY